MCRRAPSLSLLFALAGLKGSLSDCFHTSSLTPLDGGVKTSMAQPHQLPPVRASDGEKLIFEVVEFTCKGRDEYDVVGPLVVRSTPRVTAALSVWLDDRHSAYARRSVKYLWTCHDCPQPECAEGPANQTSPVPRLPQTT